MSKFKIWFHIEEESADHDIGLPESIGPYDTLDEAYETLTAIASANPATIVRAVNCHDELLAALKDMNHMGGDERGGYCVCPMNDGSADDSCHSTCCQQARAAIAKATA